MKISELKLEKNELSLRASALVSWENCNQPDKEVYIATEAGFEPEFCANPHAFLVGCLLPAMHYGEKRLQISGPVCPLAPGKPAHRHGHNAVLVRGRTEALGNRSRGGGKDVARLQAAAGCHAHVRRHRLAVHPAAEPPQFRAGASGQGDRLHHNPWL